MKAVFYARVSKDDMECLNQKAVLREWALRNGLNERQFEENYFQEEMSSRKTRPVKEDILAKIRKGIWDTLIVVRIDRFARSLQELVINVEELLRNGGRFVAISNAFDFDKKNYNATQQLQLQMFGAFAQFERELIRERTLEGLARVKAQGKVLGRPRKKIMPVQVVDSKTPPRNPEPFPVQTEQPNKRTFIRFTKVKGGETNAKRREL